MSKLLAAINKQEDGADKTAVLKIYNALKSIDGHVWDSDFYTLVKVRFTGTFPNSKKYFMPSKVYECITKMEGL